MLILFGIFFLLLILGSSISMSMFISSIVYMLVYGLPLEMIPQRLAAGVDSFTLLAVIFFMLAGNLMNSGGITKRIFSFADHLVGHFKGGLAHTNVLASVIFAGMSGSAIADAGGLGAIELKAMKEGGYDDDFSLAVTGASSLIGPVIPPSVPLVLYGVTASVSVGELFNAGLIPGVLMAIAMMVINYFISKKKDYPTRQRAKFIDVLKCFKWAFWAILLVFIIRGGIALGVFTPTEAAIVAVVYGIILSFAYKSVTLKEFPSVIRSTMQVTAGVLFLIAASTLFSWILTFSGIPQIITEFLVSLSSNPFISMLIISVILLFLGFFMDSTPIILIMTPILFPVVTTLGIDPVWFGVLMILNVLVGLVTPPVGMVLFVLSSVSGVKIGKIAKAIIPYIMAVFVVILMIIGYMYLLTLNPNLPRLY